MIWIPIAILWLLLLTIVVIMQYGTISDLEDSLRAIRRGQIMDEYIQSSNELGETAEVTK